MYYLLHNRLDLQMRRRYKAFQLQLMDDFDDLVEDFFIYLREGKDGKNRVRYQSLRRIKNREGFALWILRTFRNFLSERALKEGQVASNEFPADEVANDETPSSLLTDEEKLSFASDLIAYAHQILSPRDCFIFLRTLLTMLNKRQALPNAAMANALGMNDITYRVAVHRMKLNLANQRTRLLEGEPLPLDNPHLQMAQRINDDFTHLYPTILEYYNQSLNDLEQADVVKQLRQEYYNLTGAMLHESNTASPVKISVSAFWYNLSRFLVV